MYGCAQENVCAASSLTAWSSRAAAVLLLAATLQPTSSSAAESGACAAGQVLVKNAGVCLQVEASRPLTAQAAEQRCSSLGMELTRGLDLTGVSEFKPLAAGKNFLVRTLDRGVYEVLGGLEGWVPKHQAYPAGQSFPFVCKKIAAVACRADEIKSGSGDCLYVDAAARLAGAAARQLCSARGMQLINEAQPTAIILDRAEHLYAVGKLSDQPFVVDSFGSYKVFKFVVNTGRITGIADVKTGPAAASEPARVVCSVVATKRPK